MHAALITPELLLYYFYYLQGRDLATSASVCKAWSGTALDTLWRTQTVPLNTLMRKLSWVCLLAVNSPEDAPSRAGEGVDFAGWLPVRPSAIDC